jgi:hypothetical protein
VVFCRKWISAASGYLPQVDICRKWLSAASGYLPQVDIERKSKFEFRMSNVES